MVMPDRADAYTLTDSDLTQVGQHLTDGSPYSPPSNAYLRAKERLAVNTPGSAELSEELNALRTRAGLLPRLSTIGSRVVPYVGAFTLGWAIGTGINQKILHLNGAGVTQAPPPGFTQSMQIVPVPAGTVPFTGAQPTPADGFLASVPNGNGQRTYQIQTGGRQSVCFGVPGTPGGGTFYTWQPPTGYNVQCSPLTGSGTLTFPPESQLGYAWSPTANGFYKVHEPITDATGADVPDVTTPQSSLPAQPSAAAVKQSAQNDLNSGAYPVAKQWYEHHLDPQHATEDPTIQFATVPSCSGESWSSCGAVLDQAGYASRHRVVASTEGADLTKPAGAVLDISPAPGSRVDVQTDLAVTTNPDVMPLVIPAPGSAETYDAYAARLQALGLLGQRVDLSESALDPDRGPNMAVRTSPAVGTRATPNTTVKVYTNPDSASSPASGPGSWTAPAIPAVNLAPLNVPIGQRFPFGVPDWILGALGGWDGGGNCPGFSWPFHDQGTDLDVDFCDLEPAMQIVRPVILILSFLTLAWLFMGASLGFGGDGTEDDS